MELNEKMEKLRKIFAGMDSGVAIAFSGGVDSTFLLKVACEVLGGKVLAVTARSASFPARELNQAIGFAELIGVRHIQIDSEEMDIDGFSDNPVNRCYLCKKELFGKILTVAGDNDINTVADGANKDDLDDYRPGMIATRELGIRSPLWEADMTKEDIRQLSKEFSLPTWDKPSFACLASRIPYGEKITAGKLSMIERGEQFLLDAGFHQVRVRYHGDVARIEVGSDERSGFFSKELMDRVCIEFEKIGFKYTALDLRGYRTGSMNEALNRE